MDLSGEAGDGEYFMIRNDKPKTHGCLATFISVGVVLLILLLTFSIKTGNPELAIYKISEMIIPLGIFIVASVMPDIFLIPATIAVIYFCHSIYYNYFRLQDIDSGKSNSLAFGASFLEAFVLGLLFLGAKVIWRKIYYWDQIKRSCVENAPSPIEGSIIEQLDGDSPEIPDEHVLREAAPNRGGNIFALEETDRKATIKDPTLPRRWVLFLKIALSFILSLATVMLGFGILVAASGDERGASKIIAWGGLIGLSVATGASIFHALTGTVKSLFRSNEVSLSAFWGKPAFLIAISVGLITAISKLIHFVSFSVDKEPLICLMFISFIASFFIQILTKSPKSK